MLNPSFPRSPWFFLQIETIIDISSNLSSNSKEPSKYPKVFMTDPSNWRSCKQLFRKFGFPMRSQNYFGISVTSLSVSICISKSKLLILTFSIITFFFCSIFSTFLFLFFTEKTCILVSFSSTLSTFFFLNLNTAGKGFFLSNLYNFSQILGIFPFLFHVHVHNTNIFFIFLTCKYQHIFVRWLTFIMVVFLC